MQLRGPLPHTRRDRMLRFGFSADSEQHRQKSENGGQQIDPNRDGNPSHRVMNGTINFCRVDPFIIFEEITKMISLR